MKNVTVILTFLTIAVLGLGLAALADSPTTKATSAPLSNPSQGVGYPDMVDKDMGVLPLAVGSSRGRQSSSAPNVITGLASMPLAFTENQGQWDDQVLFRANAGGATMWFTHDGAYYQFTRRIRVGQHPRGPDISDHDVGTTGVPTYKGPSSAPPLAMGTVPEVTLSGVEGRLEQLDSIETMMIKADFVGSNPNPHMVSEGLLDYKCNYFLGNDPAKWRTDVPNYSAIVYEDIYPGIDLKYYGNGKQMEYDFIVSPGADPSQIAVRYEGAKSLSVDAAGRLVVETDWGEVVEQRPVVYQMSGGDRVSLAGEYVLKGDKAFGFELPDGYDADLTLVIDPTLVYSTYLGGSTPDYGSGIAIDTAGAAYVTGVTYSTDFPTENPYQTDPDGSYADVFVTKLSSSGNSLVYSTYLGGNSNSSSVCGEFSASRIVVDASGAAYVTGYTNATDFPTENPYQTDKDTTDVFVTKLSSSGNNLIYSTYLGGSSHEVGFGITVDASGAAYVTGVTHSTDFPTENPYQTDPDGSYADVFVTKLSSSGNSLVYSTYLGGNNTDYGVGIAVDASGVAYVTGVTYSTDFPTENPYQTDPDGSYADAFVTKLSSSGSSLVYSTYLGGNGSEYGLGIAVDASGAAYVTGCTYSTDFPTENPYQTDPDGSYADVFVTKLSSLGSSLAYSTYLGGNNYDIGYRVAVDTSGTAYVTGYTYSTDFPIKNPYQTYQDDEDAFVTKLSNSGSSLVYSTYLGGNDADYGFGIAVDASGAAYVTGATQSTDFPTENPYQTDQGGYDAFVTKFSAEGANEAPTAVIESVLPNPALEGNSVTFTGHGTDSDGIIVAYHWRSSIDDSLSSDSSFVTASLSAGTHWIYFKVQDDNSAWSAEDSLQLQVIPAGNCMDIGLLQVCADTITTVSEDVYLASGNVRINNILYFDGDLTVDMTNMRVTGTGQIEMRNIPDFINGGTQTIVLWDGSIDFSVADSIMKGLVDPALSQLELAGLKVEIDSLSLLSDGIQVGGRLVLPEILGTKTEINSLTVTESGGVQLAGQVTVEGEFDVKAAKIKDVSITFDTYNEIFSGGLTVEITGLVTIAGSVEIYQGMLNAITMQITLANPIPIDATGLSLAGGGGSVQHISDPQPLIIILTVDIVGGFEIAGFYVVELDNMGVEIQPMDYLEAFGTAKVFSQPVARGNAMYRKHKINAYFEVDIFDIIYADFSASLTGQQVSGHGSGYVQIPEDLPLELFLLYPFAGTKINAEIDFRNALMRGQVWVKICYLFGNCERFGAAFKLEYLGGTEFHFYLGTDYNTLFKIFKKVTRKGEVYQAFDVPTNAGEVLFMVRGETGPVPAFELIGPDSTLYDSNVVFMARMDEDSIAFYKVDVPDAGTWQIHIPDDEGNTFEFEALGINMRPSLSFTAPANQTSSGLIEWIDSDPDDNAEIHLYFDDDNEGFDGAPINSTSISENSSSDSYLWDYSGVTPGEYHIYAVISDTSSAPYAVYAPGTIVIPNPDAPSPPTELNAVPTDSSIQLGWQVGLDTMWGYIIHYTDDTLSSTYEATVTVGDTSGFELTGVPIGRYYRIAVGCVDSLGNYSDLSDPVIVQLTSGINNNPPQITTVDPPSDAQVDHEYSFTLTAFDMDGDPVTFVADSVPTGFSIVDGQVSWMPDTSQLGPHWLRITANDGNGGYDTLEYGVIVSDLIVSLGTVKMNKKTYFGESDIADFWLSDYDLNVDQNGYDSVSVNFSSNSDPTGIDLWLRENTPSSAEFVGMAGFSTMSSIPDPPTLLIQDGDTVFVTYSDANPAQEVVDRARWFESCCLNRGNADGQGGINVADPTYLVDFLFFGGEAPPCFEEGDADGSGSINVADPTYLTDYIFFEGPAPPPCP